MGPVTPPREKKKKTMYIFSALSLVLLGTYATGETGQTEDREKERERGLSQHNSYYLGAFKCLISTRKPKTSKKYGKSNWSYIYCR